MRRISIYTLKSILLLMIGLAMVGCAVFGKPEPKPVPTGEIRFLIQQGDEYINDGNYEKAIESYAAAVKLDPKSIDARMELGKAYANSGKIDQAMDEFASIIKIDSRNAQAHNYRGILYGNQEKWLEAAREHEAALKIEPDNLYTINRLGLMYRSMGRFQDARDTLQKAVEIDPEMDDPESRNTHYYLGIVYGDEAEYEKAEDEFRSALEHFPEDTEIRNYLGSVLENMRRYQDAADEYQETLRVDPENEYARTRLESLQRSGDVIPEITPVEIVKDDPEQYISAAPDESQYPNAGAIILLDKLSYEATAEGFTRYTVHQIVKILNDRGIEEFGEVPIPFNARSQNIGVNVARTILPDGTEVQAHSDAFHDITPPGLAEYNLYSDLMYKVISMPALQPGAILEYKVTIEDAEASTEKYWAFGGMAFQWLEPILNSKCILRVPKDVEIKWKLYNSQIEPVITHDDEKTTYVWISKDNPEVISEFAMPPLGEVVPLLMFSTAESWEDVYKWYKELAEPQEQADEAVKAKVAELILGKTTDEEKVKAIFEFVASEIRYVAIELGQGAYQPYSATHVLKYKYGDCKDKVTLLVTMLREAGIDAYHVLISPALHRKADPDIPSIGQFSHVIAAVEVEDDGYVWLDPTIATCTYGNLPAGDQGRKAFVIGKDSPEFIDTPVYSSEINKTSSTSEITLLEDGTIRGWEQTTARGQADMYMRAVYRLIRSDRRVDLLQSALNQRYPGLKIESVSISDLYNMDVPVEVRVDFSCPRYGLEQGEMLAFPLPSEGFSVYTSLVGPVERRYDLHLGYNMAMEKVLTLSLPEGYKPASLPDDRKVEHEFGTFLRKYEELDGSTVRYSVSLKIDAPVIPVASYPSFKKFVETAAREDRVQILLRK